MKTKLSFLAVLLLSTPLFARVSEYKHFPQSPQGFYMTKAEQAEWATITNDDDAKKFIDNFRAKRSPELLKQAADRAAKADQYLSLGKNLGSDSLRGKLVILLGPPASMQVSEVGQEGHAQMTSEGAMNASASTSPGAGGGGVGISATDVALAIQAGGATYKRTEYYTFSYAPKTIAGRDKDLTVVVEVDAASGADRIKDRKTAADLDQIFEQIAQASIVTAPAH